MIIIVLFSFVAYKIGKYNIKPTSSLLFFSSFGFTADSKFSFSIHSTIPIKLNLFLFSFDELRNTASRHVYKTCTSSKIRVSLLNKTFNVSKNNFLWDGNIKNQNVYYPMILICSDNFSSLDIEYSFSNKNFLVDFRSEKNSSIYLLFTVINLALGLTWIVNNFIKANFSIPLQQIMSFLPILKAISNSLLASEWEMRKFTDDISPYRKIIPVVFSILFYSFYMYVTTLAFSGWCIFRMKFSFFEKAQIFISSFLCVFGFNISSIVDFVISSLVPILFTSAGFLWYMKLNATYLATLIQLTESNIENERMKSRVSMTQNYSVITFALIFGIILIQSTTLSFDLWPIAITIIQESGIALLELVEVYFFLLRDKYVGEVDDSQNEISVPIMLLEPQKNQIVFISQEKEKENNNEETCEP